MSYPDTEAEIFAEECANLRQRIGELEKKVERIELPHTEAGLNKISLDVATKIEDLFSQHNEGGRTQRLARIQLQIREAMRANLHGEPDWKVDYRNILKPA